MKQLTTSEIARTVGVHANTIRLYEEQGMLPRVPRKANGYRLFGEEHLDQAKLIRLALGSPWIGREIRQASYDIIYRSAARDYDGAVAMAYEHLRLVQAERRRADKAVEALNRWANQPEYQAEGFLTIGEVARLIDVTPDMLRNWERDHLIAIPRDPENGYRLFGRPEIDRLRIIRLLRRARYSTMAIQRMMRHLDQGNRDGLREALDTPEPEEEIISVSDRWLSTLKAVEMAAKKLIEYAEGMLRKYMR